MKKLIFSFLRLTIMIVVISLFFNCKLQSQNFERANEDEAIIYFVKSTKMAAAITFNFFDSDQCIGRFKGSGYFIYRCKPGEHVFWASKEFPSFISADLEAGKTYLVGVYVTTGVMTANPILSPIASNDVKNINKAIKIITKKAPKALSEEELAEWGKKHEESIYNNLNDFEEKIEKGSKIKHLSGDMALPEEYIISKK